MTLMAEPPPPNCPSSHRWSNHSPPVQAFTHSQSFSVSQSKVCHQPQSNDQAPCPLQIHREPPLTRYRSTVDVVWDFFFSYFCEQNLGLGFFFFCKPNLLGFLGVLLLGFSDLLILFLGFVGFFVQIGLLDLGIHLDSKKIE